MWSCEFLSSHVWLSNTPSALRRPQHVSTDRCPAIARQVLSKHPQEMLGVFMKVLQSHLQQARYVLIHLLSLIRYPTAIRSILKCPCSYICCWRHSVFSITNRCQSLGKAFLSLWACQIQAWHQYQFQRTLVTQHLRSPRLHLLMQVKKCITVQNQTCSHLHSYRY